MDITRHLRHVRIDAWLNPMAHNPLENQGNRDVFLRTALFNEHINALARAYGLYIQNTMGDEYAIDCASQLSTDNALTMALRLRQALVPAALTSFHEVGWRTPVAV